MHTVYIHTGSYTVVPLDHARQVLWKHKLMYPANTRSLSAILAYIIATSPSNVADISILGAASLKGVVFHSRGGILHQVYHKRQFTPDWIRPFWSLRPPKTCSENSANDFDSQQGILTTHISENICSTNESYFL